MSKVVQVSQDDINSAYENFKQMYFPHGNGVGHHLWAFIGMSTPPNFESGGKDYVWNMPEENARFLWMLAGPHYKALAKVMLLNGHQYKVPVDG